MKSAIKFYDNVTGAKTHQDYLYEDKSGKLHLVIRQFYEDVVDHDGALVDYKTKTFWYKTIGDHLIKQETLKLSSDKLYDLQISRRNRVKQYLLKEAETAANPMIHPIFTLLFNWLEADLSTWINTGDASFLHDKLDNAPSTDDQKVISIFGTNQGVPKSIVDLLNLPTETNNNVIGYLKYYIK
ncbi:hypothetical protein [Pseudotenacibaculum haliotis]